jgi:HEPN domain-containing protein
MGFYADSWLREARDRVGAYPDQTGGGNYWSTTDFEKISEAVEKAIKAALVECHGSIPQQHVTTNLCLSARQPGSGMFFLQR